MTWNGAYRVVAVQLVALSGSCGILALVDPRTGLGALAGGFAVLVPNAWYAWASTRRKPGGWLLVQGVVKFVLTIALMAMVLKSLSPEPAGFFTGVVVALLAHAVGGFWQRRSA